MYYIMSSTSGTPYYTSRSMNGINQISVINENISVLQNKTQDISYNDLTDTTIIANNTQFYNTTITNSLTATNLKVTDNAIDMSNNGTYTFIDDGVSAQVVDTVHNQSIGGTKTFTGAVTATNSLTATNLKVMDNAIDMSNNGSYTFINDGVSAQVVDTVHNQSIGGTKTFTGAVTTSTSLTASNINATNLRITDNAIDMSNNGTYTFIDDGVSAQVVDTVHTQSIGGTKTFTGAVTTSTSLTATNLKVTDNSIDMANNGSYTFIDDGVSAQVVDTVHTQSIGGSKTFTGAVDIDTLVTNSTTYPDGSTQTSANYLTPIRVDATDRITATNSMETNQLTAVEIYCDTINITDSIIDNNTTGTAPKSFIYNSTTMCHKDAIVNNTPLVVAVGNYVNSNGIGLIPTGDNGVTVATINTTNRSMTFSAGGFSLTVPPATQTYTFCAITSTNTFTSYSTLSGLTNFGIRGSSTTSNQPFVNSLTGLYNGTTPTTSLIYSPSTTKTGYINANNRLVSLDTYTTQPFINMTGVSNPAYVSATFGTNEFTILSRNAITPNTVSSSFLAIPLSNTSLTYPTFGGLTTDFITQLNNINAGTKPSVNTTSTGVLTLSLTHTAATPTSATYSGYVSSNTLKLENATVIPINQYVVGTGTATNGITANINSFISAIPTAPSSTYTIRSGTGTLVPTNTTATAGVLGYVRFLSSKYWFISNSTQTNNNFVEGTGIADATRMITPTSPYVGETKIMQLTQVSGNNPTNSTPNFTAFGYVSSTTQVRLTSNPTLTSSFLFENGTTFNSLIPIGTQVVTYNSGTLAVNSTGLTASTSVGSFLGYMATSTSIQLRGLGTTTQRQNYFFTGTGAPSARNYISVAATQTPLTFGNAGSVTVGTTIPGYTKNASGTGIRLITSTANKTPFNTDTYFVTGGSLATGITRAGVSQGLSSGTETDIIITSDGESFSTSNNTTQEPTSSSVYYTAYAISTTKLYVLETITTLTASSNYIEALGEDDEFSFTFGLTTLGTFSANGYDTTNIIQSIKLQSLDSAIYNGGSGNYYYCDKYTDNSVDRFLVNATLAPASSVIYNTNVFEKGSASLSKLSYKVAPTASTFVTNCNATISFFVKSTAVVSGKQQTVLYFKTNTRATLITFDQFFIMGGFVNSGLNGGHIITFALNSTGLAGQFKLQHNTAVTATPVSFTTGNIFQQSTTVFDMFFTTYVPVVGHFFQSDDNTEPNYITAVLPITSPFTGNYRVTVAYPIIYKPVDTYYFYTPINNNSSLLNTSIFDTYESSRFKVFQSGQTFTYYPRVSYSAFSPITINFYGQTNSVITPIQYTIKTPLTYNYITPLTITDYGRTTLSFHPTETITFYTFFNINLPPNQANTTLVSVDAIQTLTNKTLTNPTILDHIVISGTTAATSTELGYTINPTLTTILTTITTTTLIKSYRSFTLPAGTWIIFFKVVLNTSLNTANSYVEVALGTTVDSFTGSFGTQVSGLIPSATFQTVTVSAPYYNSTSNTIYLNIRNTSNNGNLTFNGNTSCSIIRIA